MRVLALDTSLGATAAAIIEFPSRLVLARQSAVMERGHAEALVPMVQDLVKESGISWKEIDRIVTTVGPGSFTGLRVAVAAARAFALAHRLPVVGVSTLTAYAAPLLAAKPQACVATAIDARHGSIFFEMFSPDGHILTAPGLVAIGDAVDALRADRTLLTGNASAALHQAALDNDCDCILQPAEPAPDIEWVARLGAAAAPATAPALPLYLRAASAVPQTASTILRALP